MEKKEFPLGIIGFEKIKHLLEDDEVFVVMVNGPKKIFVEKKIGIFLTDVEFANEKEIFEMAYEWASYYEFELGEKNPVWNFRLYDGSHVTAVVPPFSPQGTVLTIYKNPNGFTMLKKE